VVQRRDTTGFRRAKRVAHQRDTAARCRTVRSYWPGAIESNEKAPSGPVVIAARV
jgi:hypothetical protein